MQTMRLPFNSQILYPNAFLYAVDALGSLRGKTYSVVGVDSSNFQHPTTLVSPLEGKTSTWRKLALLVQVTVLLPLTLLAMLFKAAWRWHHPVVIALKTPAAQASNSSPSDLDAHPHASRACAQALAPSAPLSAAASVNSLTSTGSQSQLSSPVSALSSLPSHPDNALLAETPQSSLDDSSSQRPSASERDGRFDSAAIADAATLSSIDPQLFTAAGSLGLDARVSELVAAVSPSSIPQGRPARLQALEPLSAASSDSDLDPRLELGASSQTLIDLDVQRPQQPPSSPWVVSHETQEPLNALVAHRSTGRGLLFLSPLTSADRSDERSSRALRLTMQQWQMAAQRLAFNLALSPAQQRLVAFWRRLPSIQADSRALTLLPEQSLLTRHTSQQWSERRRLQHTQRKALDFFTRTAMLALAPWQEADFTDMLRQTANRDIFLDQGNYLANLSTLRAQLSQSSPSQQALLAARAIYLYPMVDVASALINQLLGPVCETSLEKQLLADFQSINKLPVSEQVGLGLKLARQVGAKLNFFDPHASGNHPYCVGSRVINGHRVAILRHAVPTVESRNLWLSSQVQIATEYLGFLEGCRSRGESVLYGCLLKPSEDEKIRIQKLLALSEDPSFQNTFHFIRMPLDGPLDHVERFKSFEAYTQALEASLRQALAATGEKRFSCDFIFSHQVRDIVEKYGLSTLAWAKKQLEVAPSDSERTLSEDDRKRALLCLFTTLLKDRIVSELKPTFYNNSCKDAIDRGAVHLMSDLTWHNLLTGTLQANRSILREQMHWPAFMAKTQKVLTHRSQFLISFVRWIEKMQPRWQALGASYRDELGIQFEPMSFTVGDDSRVAPTLAIDYYRDQTFAYRFQADLYPLSKADEVEHQFTRDQIGSRWDLSVKRTLMQLQRKGQQELLYALKQLLSQSTLAYALPELDKRYCPLTVKAPNQLYTISASYDEDRQTLQVSRQGMRFLVRNQDPSSPSFGQIQAHVVVDLDFIASSAALRAPLAHTQEPVPVEARMQSTLKVLTQS